MTVFLPDAQGILFTLGRGVISGRILFTLGRGVISVIISLLALEFLLHQCSQYSAPPRGVAAMCSPSYDLTLQAAGGLLLSLRICFLCSASAVLSGKTFPQDSLYLCACMGTGTGSKDKINWGFGGFVLPECGGFILVEA